MSPRQVNLHAKTCSASASILRAAVLLTCWSSLAFGAGESNSATPHTGTGLEQQAGEDPVELPDVAKEAPAMDKAQPDDDPDPSDPTRIDARVGLGYKWTDFVGASGMNEVRAKLALDVGEGGTFIADVGVGRLSGFPQDDDLGMTDGRYRFFKLWSMDRTVERGYRGWGSSAELQTQGNVPGTDGANTVALGALGAYGSGKKFSFFPNLIASGTWSRNLDDFRGLAVRGDIFCTYKPDRYWPGAYFKIKPSYSYGLSDDLSGRDSFNVEASLGGAFSEAKDWWWDIQWRSFLQDEVEGELESLVPDWSVYISFTRFF